MQSIDQLLDAYLGQAAWIFGKGPSLDAFPMDEAGPLRLCINESVLVVPQPLYFFAHDEAPISHAATSWPKDCRAILQPVRGEFAVRCGIPEGHVYTYEKRYADSHVLSLSAAQLARHRQLFGNSGTVHSAIHFCRLVGANRIHMVGFDGGGGYAASLQLPDGGAQHARIRRDSINLMDELQIPHEFFKPDARD